MIVIFRRSKNWHILFILLYKFKHTTSSHREHLHSAKNKMLKFENLPLECGKLAKLMLIGWKEFNRFEIKVCIEVSFVGCFFSIPLMLFLPQRIFGIRWHFVHCQIPMFVDDSSGFCENIFEELFYWIILISN